MTTVAWSTPVLHNSDEAFRTWGQELSDKFAEVGLVQTADTGQINWATATRPGTNSFAGDEFWAFNDSLQGTYPLYLRVRYGTAGIANQPHFSVALGTGTSGSGALTGLILSPGGSADSYIAGSRSPSSSGSQSYLCHTEGFLGLVWKKGLGQDGVFHVIRSTDSSGAPDGKWACLLHNELGVNRVLSFEEDRVLTAPDSVFNQPCIVVYGNVTSSKVGNAFQAYIPFVATPKMSPLFGCCGILADEIPNNTVFNTTIVGDTPRTYLAWGTNSNLTANIFHNYSSNEHVLAMLWE